MITILYVDDEPGLLEIAQIFLQESGEFRVATAVSAKEALSLPEFATYDAIVSDYSMPGMDGIAFLKEVRKRSPDVPFILFTGRGREEVVIDAINNGADFYLQKGGEPEAQFAELAHKIRQSVKRMQAERSLQDSEKRLSDIINFLPDATLAIDRSGHVIAWNRAIEDMTGVPAAEMLGKGDHEYAIPFYGIRRPILIDLIFEPDNLIRERYAHIIHEKDILIADTTLPRPKGRAVTLLGKASPLYDPKGEIVGAIESIRDITDLKNAEQDLRKSEVWFRNLIQNSSDMIRVIGRDGRIAYSSPSTRRVMGCDPSELIGKDPFEYIHPDDRERVRGAFRNVLENTSPHIPREYRLRHADGHYIDVEAVANSLLDVPEINGVVVTIRDVTERKRAEEAIRERENTLRISEERLLMAQEIGHTGSWEYDIVADTIWGSAEGLRIFGFPPVAGNFPVSDIEACIPERGRVHQALIDLISKGAEYNLEYRIHPADGSSPKMIHSIARLDRDPEGNPRRVTGVIQDITESSRVQEEISFKNTILSTELETSQDGILIVDDAGGVLHYNRKFTEIWKIPEELIASRRDEILLQYVLNQPADPEAFLSRVRSLYERKGEKSFEEILLSDGRVLERFSAPMIGDEGKYYGRVWYFRDISGRRKAEDTLAEREVRLRSIIETTRESIVLVDEDGRIIEWNAGAEHISGFGRDETLGRFLWDILFRLAPYGKRTEEYRAETERKIRSSLQTGMPLFEKPRVTEYVRPDGSRLFIRESLFSIRTPRGFRFGSIAQDITEEKRMEDALRESEARYRELADYLPQGIFELDADLRITYANQHVQEILQFSSPDIRQGISALAFIDSSQHERVRENVRRVLLGGRVEPYEYTARKTDGSTFPVLIYSSPVYHNGDLTGFRGIIVDISDRKKREDELQRKNEELGAAFEQITATEEELRQNYEELRSHEQVLRENEEKFRVLVEYSLDGIVITDFSGTILFANRAAGLIADIGETATVPGRANILEFVASEYRETALRDIRMIADGEETRQVQYRILTAKKRTVWVECIARKIPYRGISAVLISLRDMTERMEAEELLRESETKFATVFRSSPVALTLVSAADGQFTDVNDAFERNTGFTRDMTIGKTAEQLRLFPDEDERREMLLHLRDRQDIRGMEITCRTRDGEIRACLFSARFIVMGGKPLILSTIEDITERKRAEEALRESEERFRAISEYSHNAICIIDEQGKITWANDQLLALGGYTRDQFYQAESFAGFVAPESIAWVTDNFRKFVAGEPYEHHYTAYFLTASGEKRLFAKHMTDFSDRRGRRSLIISMLDITEQKKAEAALRESESKLRRIADNSPDIIYRMSVPEGRYEYISPACITMTGYPPEDFYSDRGLVTRLIHPAWQGYFRDQWKRVLAGTAPPYYEFQIIDREGRTRWLNQRNMLVTDEQGKTVAIEGIVTDITQQKNTEAELRRSELRSIAVSENVGFWIWELTPDGVYRYSSPAVGKILGYRPEELVGKMHFYDLFDPAVRESLKATALAAFKEQEPFHDFINANRHKNGLQVILKTSGVPVFDENGIFSGYCGIDEDVTERTARESAYQAIVRSMVGTTGISSLRQITESVSFWLGADCVMIGKIRPDNQTVDVLSMLLDGKEITGSTYTLKGTPCDNVAEKGFCLYPDNVARLFPESRDLSELNIRGYVGTPLRNSAGQVFGILCALSRQPIPQIPSLKEMMEILAAKGATEIERVQIERELQESRRMLGEAMDLAHLANWEFDVASGMFTFDDRFYALYGTSAAREGGYLMPAGTYAREFIHPDEREMVEEEILRDLATTDPGYTSQLEHRIIRRDGEVRHIVVRIRITKDAGGRTISTHGANQDITDIRKAEEALRESEMKYRLLAENVHDVIWTATMDMRLTYISPSVMALRGMTVEEAMAESISDALTPSSLEMLMKSRETGLDGVRAGRDLPSCTMELEFYRKDGSTVRTETVINLALDSKKRPVGVVGVMRDITQRRQVETALLMSEEKYRSLVETSPGMIWEIDPRGTFTYISPMIATIMGYTPEEIIGKPITDLILEEKRAFVMEELGKHVVMEGPIPPIEVAARHQWGREMVIEIRPSRITGADGKLIGLRGVAYDVTERRKAEEALQLANRQLTLLGSITRHDLLNKITVILGYLKIAERQATDPYQAEYLNKIRSATNVIKSQVEFSRIYQKLGTHKPQWIELDTVVPHATVPVPVTLHAETSGIRVLADPMLEKVFANLLDNSIRHGEHVTEIRVTSRVSGRNLVIVWEDNGIGVPEDDKERIFERGFGSNTGLGMFLAREILSLTGITIRETGEPGIGVRFEITVPEGTYRIAENP